MEGNPFPTLLDTDLGLEIPFPPRLGIVEEYSEEDFTPTGDVKCCKKGGEGIPHPRGISHLRGISYLRGCVKKGGERIPHPRRGFLTHGQVC